MIPGRNRSARARLQFGMRASRFSVMVCVALLLALSGCGRRGYGQATPEDTIQSAKEMIRNGDAERLTRLVWAENDYMRAFLNRVGRFAGSLQDLGEEINRRFPAEIAKLKADAEKAALDAAKSGKAPPGGIAALMASMRGGGRGSGPRRDGPPGKEQRDQFERTIIELFADPWSWIEESADKLTTVPAGADLVAVLYEGRPILPPIGLVMRKDKGKWYFVLPTALPGVSRVMPRTKDEWSIWASLVTVFENVAIELRDDVRQGRIRDMNQLASKAGEKAFLPAALGFVAVAKSYDVRRDAERKAKADAKAGAPAVGRGAEKDGAGDVGSNGG